MRVIRIITMKSINITLNDNAYKTLKVLTESTKKNQHDVINHMLEHVNIDDCVKELKA